MSLQDKFKNIVGSVTGNGNSSTKKKTLTYVAINLFVIILLLSVVIFLQKMSTESEAEPVSVVTEEPEPTETPPAETEGTPETETPPPTVNPVELETEPETEPPVETEEPSEETTGQAQQTPQPAFVNPLTGEKIHSEAAAKRRPIAVVINNIKKSLPQSGISQASLYYEVLAEGDVTRIIALFQDSNAAKIGSIRSARHYFFYFAYDNDAFFVHHGASTEAYKVIRGNRIDNMDGQDLDGTMFWRDSVRKNTPGMSEHSSYTSIDRILKQVGEYGYRLNKSDSFQSMFKFYSSPSEPTGGTQATDITVPYMSSMKAQFKYDASTKKYMKYQNGERHYDEENGAQVSVTNVIIQKANIYQIAGDDAGRREVELVSSGSGYLATNGVYVPIRWSKSSVNSPTVWKFADGTPLTLNVGKTWVCVVGKEVEPIFLK